MSSKLISSLALFLLFVGCSAPLDRYQIYISPDGNDSNIGSMEHPIASVHKAAELARNLKKDKIVNIWLADGTYRIVQPLVLGTEDSLVKWQATPGEKPVISGGMVLNEWKKEANGAYSTQLDNNAPTQIRELFVNGQRANRARHPNAGYLNISKAGEDKRTNFFFEENDFPKIDQPNLVELVLLHDWSISRINVKSIDWKERQLTTVDWIGAKVLDFFHLTNWEERPRYFLENAIEFLDAQSEWFYDQDHRKIYYFPKPGDKMDEIEVVIPVASQLIKIEGNKETREKVTNISFEGITFEHSVWQVPESGYCGIQACMFDNRSNEKDGWNWVPAAIEVDLASDVHFNNCVIRHTGGSAIWIREESENCSVTGSHIYDISGNGVNLGEGQHRLVNEEKWWKSAPEQVSKNLEVSNSLIEHCGQQFYGAIGIWAGLVANAKIERNEIRNLPYTGVSVGWVWSPEPTPCKENVITGNHIHHVLNELSDGGGIYNLGLQPGSIISNNLIHDVKLNAGRAESNGMFLDEGITSVVVENNIIYNIARSPLRFHRATTNIVRNNVLACNEDTQPIRYNSTKEEDIEKIDNIILDQSLPEKMSELKLIIEKRKEEFGPKKQL
ncbi:MAG: hypothetical protein ACJA2S_001624 [Cyclobacteriaceae bacterium]|jgi:hypothetical protein